MTSLFVYDYNRYIEEMSARLVRMLNLADISIMQRKKKYLYMTLHFMMSDYIYSA